MPHSIRRRVVVAATAATAATAGALASGTGGVATSLPRTPAKIGVRQQVGNPGDESAELKKAFEQFYGARSAPGNVAPGAYTAAYDHVQGMPVAPTSWTEVTNKPYNADSPAYRDLVAGNSSGGVGYVTGRITGLAVDGQWVYAGGAQGGVFRSNDQGQSWTPISDGLPALATGDLRVNPADHSLWLATGEANFGDALGSGVYRLANPQSGTFDASMRVGGVELESHSIGKLEFDPQAGYVFAATSRGVYRHSLTNLSGAWQNVLKPVTTNLFAFSNITNDVVVQPGTNGQRLLANVAWRAGQAANGFYLSTNAGNTWAKINPQGAIQPGDVGPANMAYSADGKKLYVVMESPKLFNSANAPSSLGGIFLSAKGDAAGPYAQVATSKALSTAGSALKQTIIGKGYEPGVQAWYNRFVAVDPANAAHAYVGLEEVYETWDSGNSWNAVGRYWNFGLKCWSYVDANNTCDGNVIHPDQHSVAIANGRMYAGNDGGLYSRSLAKGTKSWTSLARTGGLGTLQYYSVAVGTVPGGVAVWGGLQDNGVSLIKGSDAEMVSPFGGDGGDQITDPANGCNTVGEYVYLHLQVTNNCGATDGSTTAIRDIDPQDPNPQFIAPIAIDSADPGYWVAGGEYIYGNTKTWASTSGADWEIVGDTGNFLGGVYHSATAVASQNHVVWAGWCGSCSSSTWKSGIVTNYDPTKPGNVGALHQVPLTANTATGKLPNRYVAGVTIDPADPSGKTVYVTYNGFSAHWVEGPGAGIGHVFRTTDGGQSWTDVSGPAAAADSLPDVPASHLAITPSHTLVLTTDVGVFVSTADGHWMRAGTSLPYTIATDAEVGPDGNTYIATFGRGIWKMPTP
ncbi:MAG TPA: hypothetical protein VFQ85_01800 [Mycobacteriales bacterium]|jgi:hypothetical protein|nr:hypothetical protein [Mycobacteriales bacterium]